MRQKTIFALIAVLLMAVAACKEQDRLDHINNSTPAPAAVVIKSIKDTPGGAVIRYTIPDDDNLLGVKAVYIRNGELNEVKASRYVDSLKVEGFGNTDAQKIEIYSVGTNGKLSAPTAATIHPLTPIVRSVKFDLEATFGGVAVSLDNNTANAELAIVLMTDTSEIQEWKELQTFHTKAESMKFPRRGLQVKALKYGVYLRDRWGNVSDTISKTLLPIEEIKLPKDGFRNAALPTDFYQPAEDWDGWRLEKLWDGGEGPTNKNFYASKHSAPIPVWFTISLGHKMSISRIQKWPRESYELYSGPAPRVFQVWGSSNPNPDGSWDNSWHLLGEFEQKKPSGYREGRDVGPVTDEDRDYWYNKTEFELIPTKQAPDPYQTVTHLRFKILSTFGSYGTDATMGQVIIAELTFWGQLKD